jgi:hypothetical protein
MTVVFVFIRSQRGKDKNAARIRLDPSGVPMPRGGNVGSHWPEAACSFLPKLRDIGQTEQGNECSARLTDALEPSTKWYNYVHGQH